MDREECGDSEAVGDEPITLPWQVFGLKKSCIDDDDDEDMESCSSFCDDQHDQGCNNSMNRKFAYEEDGVVELVVAEDEEEDHEQLEEGKFERSGENDFGKFDNKWKKEDEEIKKKMERRKEEDRRFWELCLASGYP